MGGGRWLFAALGVASAGIAFVVWTGLVDSPGMSKASSNGSSQDSGPILEGHTSQVVRAPVVSGNEPQDASDRGGDSPRRLSPESIRTALITCEKVVRSAQDRVVAAQQALDGAERPMEALANYATEFTYLQVCIETQVAMQRGQYSVVSQLDATERDGQLARFIGPLRDVEGQECHVRVVLNTRVGAIAEAARQQKEMDEAAAEEYVGMFNNKPYEVRKSLVEKSDAAKIEIVEVRKERRKGWHIRERELEEDILPREFVVGPDMVMRLR